jgi:hypothetical protein
MSLVTLAGNMVTALTLRVPSVGVWVADCDLDTGAEVSGAVVLEVGALSLTGTAARTGTHGERTLVRVVGGAGGWATVLPTKAYHADNGVKLSTVVGDIIREAGETLSGTLTGTVGIDFVRQDGPASRSIRQAIGTAAWWVGYDGATRVAERVQTEIATAYQVLSYDPRDRVATIATDAPEGIVIGSVIRTGLDTPIEVVDLEIAVSGGALRLQAWGRATT